MAPLVAPGIRDQGSDARRARLSHRPQERLGLGGTAAPQGLQCVTRVVVTVGLAERLDVVDDGKERLGVDVPARVDHA
ncbi:hypothetical protein A7J15_00175 [Microbacterium sediminis]|uniref:Uncharacterized protein n=1 Tax=Microbacterium sediminis TaxID=904291 RepID=A0A1B9NFX9_9MICO|nr:hypothetical protein A7J15_00175 [Microbacterium sediminis]